MDQLLEAVLPFLVNDEAAQGEVAQAAQEAPAPADAPVPHLSPQEQLLRAIHSEVQHLYKQECLKGKSWLKASLLKPEMQVSLK